MDASTINLPTAGRRRGRYSDTFKAEIVAACKALGVSTTAAVALANGLNANRKRPATPSPPGSPNSVFVSTPNDVDTNTLQFLLNSASAYACPAVGQ